MVEFAGPIAGEQLATMPVILSSERAPASSLLYPATCGRHVEPHHVGLRASRHPLARDIVPVQRPVREHGAGERLRALRTENTDPANRPERCSDGYSPLPPPWWPGELAP